VPRPRGTVPLERALSKLGLATRTEARQLILHSGLQPVWSRDGRELFYREGDWLMTAAVQPDPFRLSTARRLFEMPRNLYSLDPNFADYDVAANGRFIAARNDHESSSEIQVVLNWQEELKQRVPTR
jgi:hypothetical protein